MIPDFIGVLSIMVLSIILIGFRIHKYREIKFGKIDVLLSMVIIIVAAMILLGMGLEPKYKYGPIALWSGNTQSNQNSQQIADPYSFTHITHGIGFYAILKIAASKLPLGARFVIAIGVEALWEVLENTDLVINRYRTATLSLDYYGDSVINVIFDIMFMAFGFAFASRFSKWTSIFFVIAVEVILTIMIRDSLLLNIIMLLYPIASIKDWQLKGTN